MATANEELFDALVRHQIYLMRLGSEIRNRIQRLLDETERDLADTIRSRLRTHQGGLSTPGDLRRLEFLLGAVRRLRTRAWDEIDAEWVRQMQELARAEPAHLQGIIGTVSPVVFQTILPDARLLQAIATSRPFEGRTLRQWARSLRAEDLRRIENQIRLGMVAGDTPAQIARRVVGTARLNGVDGVTQITRRNAEAITRTAVNHVANEAREEFMRANADLFSEEQFVATLDARTTPVCRAMDGQRFPIGQGPIPPLHFGCRSLRVPVLAGEALSNRPANASTEAQLLREFAAQRGIDVPASRAGLPHGTRGLFDTFRRRRVRELTGTVPGSTTYQQWLTGQSATFQDDVLGATRARLFRQGGLTLDRFVSRAGDQLPLSALARLEADAFRAAGLDPSNFF